LTIRPPRAEIMAARRLCKIENPLEVDGDDGVPFLFPHPHEEIVFGDAGVVDQMIDFPVVLEDGLDDGGRLFELAHVRLVDDRPAAFGGDRRGDLVELRFLDIDQHDRRAFARETPGDRFTDPL